MPNYQVHLTLKSANAKTGPIPVSTTSSDCCPPSCPFAGGGCYAKSGPLALHWAKISAGSRGGNWKEFCDQVERFPAGQLWRHNQAGDLPGSGEAVDADALQKLVSANKGKRGFTYTHKTVDSQNHAAIKSANEQGFTVNLSGNNVAHADELVALGIGPVVTVLPSDQNENFVTPAGNRVVICPATQREGISCATCKLCSVASRKVVVGFPAHGTGHKKASTIAKAS